MTALLKIILELIPLLIDPFKDFRVFKKFIEIRVKGLFGLVGESNPVSIGIGTPFMFCSGYLRRENIILDTTATVF